MSVMEIENNTGLDSASQNALVVTDGTYNKHDSSCLSHLILRNFKSYSGEHIIGPFKKLTSIIGPNGAGKSNLLDAIAFVLGVQQRNMRNALNGYIYIPSSASQEKPTEASVTLIFAIPSKDSIQYKKFTRSISRTSLGVCSSHTSINGETVKWNEYQDSLRQFRIVSKAKSFLAFQGDVVAVARKTPYELSQMLEQMCEADVLRGREEETGALVKSLSNELKTLTVERQRCEVQFEDFKQELEAVDKYRSLRVQIDIARCTLITFKIYVNEVEFARSQQLLSKLLSTQQSLEEELQVLRMEIRNDDSLLLKLQHQQQRLDVDFRSMENETHGYKKQLDSIMELTTLLEDKKEELLDSKERNLSILVDKKKEVCHIEHDLQQNKRELESLEDILKKDQDRINARFPSEIKAAYDRVRNEVLRASASANLSVQIIRSKRDLLLLQLSQVEAHSLENEVKTLQVQHEEKESALKQCQQAMGGISTTLKEHKECLEQTEKDFEQKSRSIQEAKTKREMLLKEKDILELQILKFSIQREKYGKPAKNTIILEELKTAINTHGNDHVIGLLPHLCHPTARKYELPMRMALGRFWNCIVVDTFETARDAVEYLRSKNLEVHEFASLDVYKSKLFSDHNLRKFVSLCKNRLQGAPILLSIDCVDYPPEYSNLLQCILQDTLITDTLENATKLVFGEMRQGPKGVSKCNVVTMSGDKMLKNGNIVISSTSQTNPWRVRYREKAYDTLPDSSFFSTKSSLQQAHQQIQDVDKMLSEDKRIQLEQEVLELSVVELPKLRLRVEEEEQRLQLSITQLTEAQKRYDFVHETLSNRQNELYSVCQRDLPQCSQELLEAEEALRESQRSTATFTINGAVVTYNELYEEYERFKTQQSSFLKKRKEKLVFTIELDCKLQHMTETIEELSTAVTYLEKDIEKADEGLLRLKSQYRELQQATESSKNTLEQEIKPQLQHTVQSLITTTKALQEKRTLTSVLRDRLYTAERDVERQRSSLDNLCNVTRSLVKSSFIERIPLPVDFDELPLFAEKVDLRGCHGISLASITQENQLESAVNSTALETVPLSIFYPFNKSAAYPSFKYHWVLNEEDHKFPSRGENLDQIRLIERDLEEKLVTLTNNIEEKRPNLRAKEQVDTAEKKNKEILEKINDVKQRKHIAEKEYKTVHQERIQRFMDCFYHTQNAVQKYYKRLTGGYQDDLIGGSAFLELSDDNAWGSCTVSGSSTESALLPGVFFNVIPPSKQFSSLKYLSGGEKTIAALALLFALHSYRATPFFVLDEIDANLDPQNLNFLAEFIQREETQIVIISHCERVFSRAEQLIGVYVDPARESSAVLSLNLLAYADNIVQ